MPVRGGAVTSVAVELNPTDEVLAEYYRCPLLGNVTAGKGVDRAAGYFALGSEVLFGRPATGRVAACAGSRLYDVSADIVSTESEVHLPFDLAEVIDNLRYERYAAHLRPDQQRSRAAAWLRSSYYFFRPLLPVKVRRRLQQAYLHGWRNLAFPRWPVDTTVEALFERVLELAIASRDGVPIPFIWFWPHGATACVTMTHDVETAAGRDACDALMDLDASFDVRSSFQLIPEQRYRIPAAFVDGIKGRGFEVNIHDLDHSGDLYDSRSSFLERIGRVNAYAKAFDARGFRSGAMYRNLDWYDALEVSYDMSVPNVAHLEAQQGGCCTVMPYFVGDVLELPLTTTQDYAMFHILRDYSGHLWREQMERVRQRHGLTSFNVHPDYIAEARARDAYRRTLALIAELRTSKQLWVASPGDVDRWWRQRSEMKLVESGSNWRAEGPGSERACVAYASVNGDRVSYRLA
jgi:hypothetical protein